MSNEPTSPRPTANTPKVQSLIFLLMIGGIVAYSVWQDERSAKPVSVSSDTDTAVTLKSLSPKADADLHKASYVPDEDEPTLPAVTPESGAADKTAPDERSTARQGAANEIPAKADPDRAGSPRAPPAGRAGEATGKPGPLSEIRSNPKGPSQAKPPKQEDSARQTPTDNEVTYLVPNQTIRNLNNRVVFKGTVDLKPTLDRIERGESHQHRNDGAVFQNRESRLPRKPSGYYKEYVHPTPGENGPGPQRIIIGKQGEVWYTADHYKSFKKIK